MPDKTKPTQAEQYPPIGNFIHYHIIQQTQTKSAIANAMGIGPKGLRDYFKKDSLQFAVLWKLSLILKHNFLAQLGEYLPYRFETIQEKALKKELAAKNDYIHKLEIQLETLKEMINK